MPSDAEIAAIRATLDGGRAAVADNDSAAPGGDGRGIPCRRRPASHNRALAKMVVTLHHQTARYWLYAMRAPSLDDADDGMAALAEHRALADAIAARDPERRRAPQMLVVLGDFPAEDEAHAWKPAR